MNEELAAAISRDAAVPKVYRHGMHRVCPPDQTIARLREVLPVFGITRIANVTGLDRIGVPVAVAYRPNSRSLAVSQGKGLDLAAAKASALMESIESWHAERITRPVKLASYAELSYSHRLADVDALPRLEASPFHQDLPLLWIEAWDLAQAEPVWTPFELVHTNYTLPLATGSGCFMCSSNGLASGNHLLEAISHGICEVVERDASTLWYLLPAAQQAAMRIDLTSVDDDACVQVLERYARADIEVAAWETTSDVGIPSFMCMIADRDEALWHRVQVSSGMGCHVVREVALLRALTEAAQSRLTVIVGTRDDIVRADYLRTRSPDVMLRGRAMFQVAGPLRAFRDGPTFAGDTLNDDVAWIIERLRRAGLQRVLVVDLTRREFGIPVVRVIIPGLEGPAVLTTFTRCAPGGRARASLEQFA